MGAAHLPFCPLLAVKDKWHNMASAENGPSPSEGHGSGDVSSRSPAAAQKPPMLSELKVRMSSHV